MNIWRISPKWNGSAGPKQRIFNLGKVRAELSPYNFISSSTRLRQWQRDPQALGFFRVFFCMDRLTQLIELHLPVFGMRNALLTR